jgi:hypothetical protein
MFCHTHYKALQPLGAPTIRETPQNLFYRDTVVHGYLGKSFAHNGGDGRVPRLVSTKPSSISLCASNISFFVYSQTLSNSANRKSKANAAVTDF